MTKNKVNIRITLPADTGLHSEVMWAKPLGGRRYQLALDNKERHAFVEQMKRLAASIEWADGQLCALNLSTPVVFETVFEALLKLEESGVLGFETTESVDYEAW